jgi:hypothetical protein
MHAHFTKFISELNSGRRLGGGQLAYVPEAGGNNVGNVVKSTHGGPSGSLGDSM